MKAKKTLLFRGGAIGDWVVTLPAMERLRAVSDQLVLVVQRQVIPLCRLWGKADEIYALDGADLILWFGGQVNPKMISDTPWGRRFREASHMVSYLADPDGYFRASVAEVSEAKFISISPHVTECPASLHLMKPLEEWGIEVIPTQVPDLRLQARSLFHCRQELLGFLNEPGKACVMIHPGSGSVKKNWNIEEWCNLVDLLHQDYNVLICGGEADQVAYDLFSKRKGFIYDMPLDELAVVIARCEGFIGHDSGITHLAAAVGCSCIALFGPTRSEIWAPGGGSLLSPHVTVLHSQSSQGMQFSVKEIYGLVCDRFK